MTKNEILQYKIRLQSEETELESVLRDLSGIQVHQFESELDTVEAVIALAERDIAIRNLDRNSILLNQVREALRRIDQDTFGICLHCEEDISPKRLNALPWTPLCILCQEAEDRRSEGGDIGDALVATA